MSQNDQREIPIPEREVNNILIKTSSPIMKRTDLNVIGRGVAMPSNIVRELSIDCECRDRLSKSEIRKLLIQFGEELLNNINSNEEIQPYLVKRPFTIENVEIIIYNHDSDGRWLYDPGIGVGHLASGLLEYKTHDLLDEGKYKNIFKETYEEALKLLHNENQIN